MVMTGRILGLNKVIFWDRRSQFGSLQDDLWDITMCFFGTGEVDIWVITR